MVRIQNVGCAIYSIRINVPALRIESSTWLINEVKLHGNRMIVSRRILGTVAAMSCLLSVAVADLPAQSAQEQSSDADVLAPMRVTAPAYRVPLTPVEKFRLALLDRLKVGLLNFLMDTSVVLTPERLAQASRNVVYPTLVLQRADLGSTTDLEMEQLGARGVPTGGAQKFSPNVESALVLVEGIPLNDAWNGSTPWDNISREGLARIEVVPGGAAVPWSDGIGGVSQYFRIPAMGQLKRLPLSTEQKDSPYPPPPKEIVVSTGRVAVGIGNQGTQVADFVFSQPTQAGVLQILGRGFKTTGYDRLERKRQGRIDSPVSAEQEWLEIRWRQPLGKRSELTASLRRLGDNQNLGTIDQQNRSDRTQASLTFSGSIPDGFNWTGVFYGESGHARSSFSLANENRSVEAPFINEYARPTEAWGTSWTASWAHQGNNRTNVGLDFRSVRGESRNELDSPAGTSTRDLRVGGKEETAGAFILHHRRLTTSTQATLGARLDHWIVADGFRRTTEPGLAVTEIYFPQKRAFAFTPTGGLISKIGAHWRIQASAQSGLIQPALSQRFGLRGQDSFILEPEAALRAERRTRGEMSVEYFRGERIRFRASVFADERHDVVGSQALGTGDSVFGLNMVLPAAYEVRRWINLDRARLHGAQFSILWATRKTVRLEADFIISHSHVDRVSAAPDLEGRELTGVPRVAGRATATWQVSPQTSIRARVRATGESYANEENTRRLHPSVVADLSWNHKLSVHTEAFLWIENIGNVRVETIRGPADLVYLDSPRTFLTGVRLIW